VRARLRDAISEWPLIGATGLRPFEYRRDHRMTKSVRRWKQVVVRGYSSFRGDRRVYIKTHLRPYSFADVPEQLCFAF
jgi:hypothetical protein